MKKTQKISKTVLNHFLDDKVFRIEFIDDNGAMRIFADLKKIDFEEANEKIEDICKKFKLILFGCGTNISEGIRDWHILPKSKLLAYQIYHLVDGKKNGDIFVEVRQRVVAFKYYRKFHNIDTAMSVDIEFLDDAYRFLYQSIEPDFIIYCAKQENMDPIEYVKSLTQNG